MSGEIYGDGSVVGLVHIKEEFQKSIDPIVSQYGEEKAFWIYSKHASRILGFENRIIPPLYSNSAGVNMNATLLSKFFTVEEVIKKNVSSVDVSINDTVVSYIYYT